MQYIVEKRGYRWLPLLVLAVAAALLVLVARDSEAVHNEALLEVDGNAEFDGGFGFDPGTNNCNPFSVNGPDNGDPDDCIDTAASFDWADDPDSADQEGLCTRDESGVAGEDGYVTEATLSAGVLPAGASLDSQICQADFYQAATDDTSYHTGSDKDYQDVSGPEPVWHCIDSSNATSKADILNAYFAVTTTAGDDQVVYIGAERDVEHGAVYNGYWIMQDGIGVPGATTSDADQLDCSDGTFNFSGVHVCGDVLVLFNYESGGRVGKVGAFQWVPADIVDAVTGDIGCDRDGDDVADATCTDAEQNDADSEGLVPGPGFLCVKFTAGSGDCRATLSFGDDLCGRVNGADDCTIAPKKTDPNPPPCSGPDAFATPWEPKDGDPTSDILQPPTFSEVGINLTDLNLELPCIATLMVESRSSPSTTATLKDFVPAPTGAECVSSIRTEIHNVANHGTASDPDIQDTTVYRGTVIHDAAFVTPEGNGPNATGTVTFTLYSDGDCGNDGGSVIGTPETVTITDQIPGGIPSGDEGQIDSSNFDTDDTAATEISYTASADLDDPYGDSTLAEEDCENLTIISPSTTLDKSLAFSIEVTYSYSETNDGDDPLTNPSVTDAVCVANGGTVEEVVQGAADPFPGANVGDDNGDGVLDPGETFEFECTVTLTEADLADFPITNTAIGHGTDSQGKDVTVCTAGPGTPTPAPGPNNGQFCDPDETDSTSIDITVDQGKP